MIVQPKVCLNIDVKHGALMAVAKGESYRTEEGYRVVFFDEDNAYYSPLDVFQFKAEAQEYIDAGLKNGVSIA